MFPSGSKLRNLSLQVKKRVTKFSLIPSLKQYLRFDKRKNECPSENKMSQCALPGENIFFGLFSFLFPWPYCCSYFIRKSLIQAESEQSRSNDLSHNNAVLCYRGRTWRGYTLQLNFGAVFIFAKQETIYFDFSALLYRKVLYKGISPF